MPYRALILAWLLAAAPAWAEATRAWQQLASPEQAALAPLAADWDRMPGLQRERLLLVARGYSRLTPPQQKLLHSRLRAWARMTHDQREAARENFRRIQTLPKTDQDQIKQQWLDSLCQEFGQPAGQPAGHPVTPR